VDTIVVLMGRAALPRLTARLLAAGRAPDTPAACVQSATTSAQRVAVATLATIADVAEREGLEAPMVTVIGAVAAYARETRAGVLPQAFLAAIGA
jgi:uroporphyrinogen III methyltransferase/synthase